MHSLWKTKLCSFQIIQSKVYDRLYMSLVVLIRRTIFFICFYLRCLSCARFRSHFLSHLSSPFVLLVVFSCLNAAQQSSPNPSTTLAETSKATLSFVVVALLRSPCPDSGIDIPMAKPPCYLLRRHFPWSPDAHSDLVYNFRCDRTRDEL